jgi:hypothetical protein
MAHGSLTLKKLTAQSLAVAGTATRAFLPADVPSAAKPDVTFSFRASITHRKGDDAMSRWTTFVCGLAAVAVTVSLAGCGEKKADVKPSPEPADAKIQAALAELPAADRAAAEKQGTCPVSGERLGSMGKPVKIAIKDSQGEEHEVFLCCSGCEGTIKDDPDTYLAKLKK